MSTQPEQGRHLAAVPDSQELAREQAAAAKNEIERLTRLAELAQQHAHHQDQIEGHKTQLAKIEAEIRALHAKQGSTVKAGDTSITWKNPSRSFNVARFMLDYPATTHPHLYTTKTILDATAIPPKLKDQYMAPGTGEGTLIIK